MAGLVDKRLVATHFDLHAASYDQVTPLQASMATRLAAATRQATGARSVRRILELGCGTGRLTQILADTWPQARIDSLDVAPAMVQLAQQRLGERPVNWHIADAEDLPDAVKQSSYDLIISNAMVQWLRDPGSTLASCRALLAAEGNLAVSTFGPRTFHELRSSFQDAEQALGLATRPHLMQLPTPQELAAWIGGEVTSELVPMRYDSLRDFLRSLKQTGATLARPGMSPVSRALHRALHEAYQRRFAHPAGGVTVTYDVLVAISC